MRFIRCTLLAVVSLGSLYSLPMSAQEPKTAPDLERRAMDLLSASPSSTRDQLLAAIGDDDLGQLVTTLIGISDRRRIAGELTGARDASRMALVLADRSGDRAIRARAWNGLASALIASGEYDEALAWVERSRDSSRLAGDTSALAEALEHIGVIHFRRSDTAESLAASEESLRLRRELGEPIAIARALSNIGMASRLRGDFDRAARVYEEALALSEGAGAERQVAQVLNRIGVLERELGNNQRAIALYQRSFEIANRLGERGAAANTLSNLAMSYQDAGSYDIALEHFLRALAVMEAIGDRLTAAVILGNLGFLYREQGNDALAVQYYRRSLQGYEAVGSKEGIARISLFLARVHATNGEYEAAEPLFARALELRRAIGDRAGMANLTIDYGVFAQQKGDLAHAIERYREGLSLLEALGERRSISWVLLRLANAHNTRKEYRQALDRALRAAEITMSTGQSRRHWETQLAAGRAWRGLGDPIRARQAFEQSITDIETLLDRTPGGEEDRQRIFERRVDPYYEMVSLLADAADPLEAMRYAERAKARVLLDVLRHGRVDISKSMSQPEQDEERRLMAAIASAATAVQRERERTPPDARRVAESEEVLRDARAHADAFRTTLYARHPDLRVRRSESPPISAEDLATLVPDERTALVEYVVTHASTYVFVVTKASPLHISVHRIDRTADTIAGEVGRFREALGRRDLGFRGQSKALYEAFLGPIKDRLTGRSHVVIVPDGPLWDLPFQALISPEDRFVIERHTLASAPSLTALHAQRSLARRAGRSVVAFGDPPAPLAGSAAPTAPLPAAAAEAMALQRLYGPGTKIFIGGRATEAHFKREAASSSILHVATHGILNNADPMSSHLLLASSADGTTEDGRLQAREILSLDLDGDLAVLSGCDTARGRIGPGEGVIGLTWAFFVAGVPTTVVGQWKVDSESTAQLMIGMHRRLAAGGPSAVTPADALRASALAMLASDRHRHPFYWAGFVVVGDGLRVRR